ncbi:hypothetical protein T459_27875 [Capsicum annuum]|uniref:Uncharacterized protein n=1 Tax=Capsicum annuum TaxID=4072 RepID=A0A2G2YF64_CAPAN|nr:hypothetical protein T459_27875 [Capsicum annuum]
MEFSMQGLSGLVLHLLVLMMRHLRQLHQPWSRPADFLDSTDKDMSDANYCEISMYKTALEEQKRRAGRRGGRKG